MRGIDGFILLLLSAACGGGSSGDGAPDGPAPTADGIAGQYPGDQGIGGDPRVIFADDFESYRTADDLWDRWDAVYNDTSISTVPANVYRGSQSLEFTIAQSGSEVGAGIAKAISPERDVIYLRYYSKFDPSFDVVGSSHNGASISAHYYVDGNATPGVPADGTNKYLIAYEDWRGDASDPNPGHQNIYIYHPEQSSQWGDHLFPDGSALPYEANPFDFGDSFVERPMFVPELGRWYLYEVMLKANTPSQRDGRVTCWIDGELIADFPNLRLRDIDTLTIDRIDMGLHAGSNPSGETHKWYDNVVVATAYVGPMAP